VQVVSALQELVEDFRTLSLIKLSVTGGWIYCASVELRTAELNVEEEIDLNEDDDGNESDISLI
jgi:hypothetical protein